MTETIVFTLQTSHPYPKDDMSEEDEESSLLYNEKDVLEKLNKKKIGPRVYGYISRHE